MRRGRGRVLIVVQNLPVPLDRRVWQECGALMRAGFGVSVICPKGPGDPSFDVIDGVRIHKYRPAPPARGVLGFAVEFAYAWLVTALLAVRVYVREGFEVLQACNPPDTYWALARLFRPFGVKFVYDQHDLCPELFDSRFEQPSAALAAVLRWLERRAYRSADHVIATNETYRGRALGRGGVSPERVTIVRSGPRRDHFRPGEPVPALRHGRNHLCCYLGVMGPQDGVDVVLRAASVIVHQLGRADVHFALLGFGDCYENLRALATELDLDEFVTFTGRAGYETICEYLSTADVGLAPDPRTAFNDASTHNKVLEYMAFAVPVVAFDLHENEVSAGAAGVYVESGDVAGYAKAIVELLDDPERRAAMGARGRARIETALSWEHQVDAYVAVYEGLMSESAS